MKRPKAYQEKICRECGKVFSHTKGRWCSEECENVWWHEWRAQNEQAWRLRQQGMSFRMIADRMGVTQTRARDAHHKFLRMMRHPSRRQEANDLGIEFK
jgi:transposase-like protein